MAKCVLSSVQVLVLGVSKSGKEKSPEDCLGTGRRSQGPNQDKSLVFAFAFSEFYSVNFTFLQVVLFKKFINSPPSSVCVACL